MYIDLQQAYTQHYSKHKLEALLIEPQRGVYIELALPSLPHIIHEIILFITWLCNY